jgi:hypothetical protein
VKREPEAVPTSGFYRCRDALHNAVRAFSHKVTALTYAQLRELVSWYIDLFFAAGLDKVHA